MPEFFEHLDKCTVYWSLFYLAGVSHAGLGDVTVVDSVTARHPSQLVLSQTTIEEEGRWRMERSR